MMNFRIKLQHVLAISSVALALSIVSIISNFNTMVTVSQYRQLPPCSIFMLQQKEVWLDKTDMTYDTIEYQATPLFVNDKQANQYMLRELQEFKEEQGERDTWEPVDILFDKICCEDVGY